MRATAGARRPIETAVVPPPGPRTDEQGRPLDAEAFAELYERYRPRLRRFVMARTGDRDRTEDLVQEVFAKAYAVRGRFDPTRPFWPWLASIATRECIDAYRRRSSAAARTAELVRAAARAVPFDSTATVVVRSLEEQRLARELAALPPRQRIALQLVALDAWSYADVAERLGYSVPTVKALLVRARRKLREAGVGVLGAGVGALRSLRDRWHRAAARMQATVSALSGCSELPALWSNGAGPHLVVVAVAGVMALGSMAPAGSTVVGVLATPASTAPAGPGVPESTPGAGVGAGRSRTAEGGLVAGPGAQAAVLADAERTANESVVSVLPPEGGGDDPESVVVSTFAVSPHYDEDHTLFVVGHNVVSPPLLLSRDGGASWQRLRAVGLAPVVSLLLPPAYPHDGRLFALTAKGLQVSRNGGDTFETAVPLAAPTAAAVSPAFDAGDPVVLVAAGSRLWRYRDDTGAVDAVELGPELAGHRVMNVSYPAAGADHDVILGTAPVTGDPGYDVSRCSTERLLDAGATGALRLHCDSVRFPWIDETLPLRVPSAAGSNLVYLPFRQRPYVSLDGARTFQPIRDWWYEGEEHYLLYDLQPVPFRERSAVTAQQSWRQVGGHTVPGPQLSRTDDAGRTWRSLFVDLPRFEIATRVVVTPTGRILAASRFGGIACSEDDGRSWARLCPTSEAA